MTDRDKTVFTIVEASESVTQVAIRGRLDVPGVSEIEPGFSTQVTSRRRPAIVDLSEVSFIGSLGIGVLVGIARGLKLHGAATFLVEPQEMVDKALRAGSIHRVIPIVARDEALRLIREGPD